MNSTFQAERYISLLAGDPDAKVTFFVSPESTGCDLRPTHIHEPLCMVEDNLRDMNEMGAGVFMAVNMTDGKGRRKENIQKYTAVYTDLDYCTKLPDFKLEASMVIKTKKGFHAYWLVEAPTAEWCEGVNRTIAKVHDGDIASVDVARVLRVPGFNHMKDGAVEMELISDSGIRYTPEQVAEVYPPSEVPRRPVVGEQREAEQDSSYGLKAADGERAELGGAIKGQRNQALTRSAFKLGTLVGGGALTEATAWDALEGGCRENGYMEDHDERGIVNSIRSSLTAGMKCPRNVEVLEEMSSGKMCGVETGRIPGKESVGIQVEEQPGLGDHKSGCFERCATAIDRRIDMGFNPVPSPLGELNVVLGGGAPAGAVTLLGAPPGMGKSSLALDWCYKHAVRDQPALFISLELNELDLYSRLCTLQCGHSWLAVRCGKHRQDLMDTVRGCDSLPFYAVTRNQISNCGAIRQPIEELTEKYGASPFVVIDYIQQFIPMSAEKEQWAVMSDISGEVTRIAQDTGSTMLCITALNRQSYDVSDNSTGKPNRYAILAAAKNSGSLEYDAEVIMGLQMFEPTDDGQFGWICIAKNRSGGGAANIPIKYDGVSGLFYDANEDDIYKAIAKEKEGRRKIKLDEAEDKFLKALSEGPYRDVDALAKTAGIPRAKCREVFGKLLLEGKISKSVDGTFRRSQ